MPIKSENKGRYPANWPEIRQRVLRRAKNRCEGCGVKNKATGYRFGSEGKFVEVTFITPPVDRFDQSIRAGLIRASARNLVKTFKIVLTIAHLNHIPEDCRMENLKALCQRCHNRYDAEHRKQTRRARLKEIPK